MKKVFIPATAVLLLTLCSGCAALAQYGDVIAKAAYGIAKYIFSHEGEKTDNGQEKQEL